MRGNRPPYRLDLECLESRLAPAVTVKAFESNPGVSGMDSLLIKGSSASEFITIKDFGNGFQILKGKKEKSNHGIDDPRIVKVILGGGQDRLTYLVPNGVTLDRQIVIRDGGGRDRIEFNNDDNEHPGVQLDPGSNFSIDYQGGGRSGDIVRAVFREVLASNLDINLVGKGGSDDFRVTFKDDDFDFDDSIDYDSNVNISVQLGGGGSIGNFCRIELGDQDSFFTDFGHNDTNGSIVDIDVVGGKGRDVVVLVAWQLGLGSLAGGPATSVLFDASLGAGNDFFWFITEGIVSLNPDTSITVNVFGGGGKDRLRSTHSTEHTPGGFVDIDDNAILDISFFGEGGNDKLEVFTIDFGVFNLFNLEVRDTGTFRLRLDGGEGNDRVVAGLTTPDSIVGADPGIIDFQLLGGLGNDTMGLDIDDKIGMTYIGDMDMALLDGGEGKDKLDAFFGIDGNVNKQSIP